MATIFDGDVLIHHVIATGLPGDGMTSAEASALRADFAEVMSRSTTLALDDLTDVDTTGISDGDTLVYDSATGQVVPGELPGLTVRDDVTILDNTQVLYATTAGGIGIGASAEPGRANLYLAYGGTGTSSMPARMDHTHEIRTNVPFRFGATGSLSSGTRPLTSGTITGLDPDKAYVLTGRLSGQVRGEGTGAGYSLPRITINGSNRDIAERPRTVAGVQVGYYLEHFGVNVAGLSTVNVAASIAYSEGDPVWVGGGELIIEIRASR